MIAEKSFMKYGFINDIEKTKLKEILKDKIILKDVHIDIYPENPLNSSTLFMLLLRAYEKNVKVLNDNNRIVLIKNNKDKTCIMNILISKITECLFRIYENSIEFILNIQNTYYRVTIFN